MLATVLIVGSVIDAALSEPDTHECAGLVMNAVSGTAMIARDLTLVMEPGNTPVDVAYSASELLLTLLLSVTHGVAAD